MANYIPTRADQLQPGDVVRNPYSGDDNNIRLVKKMSRGIIALGYVADGYEGLSTFRWDDLLDKRITDEEYEALIAQGVRDE